MRIQGTRLITFTKPATLATKLPPATIRYNFTPLEQIVLGWAMEKKNDS